MVSYKSGDPIINKLNPLITDHKKIAQSRKEKIFLSKYMLIDSEFFPHT